MYVWHLLTNLKNNYLLKNCSSGPIKNVRILVFKMLYLKKIKKKTLRYYYFTPVYRKSWWYDLQFLRYRAWQMEIGYYRSFFAFLHPFLPPFLKIQKIRILKKWKKNASDIIILHMCTKNHNHIRTVPEIRSESDVIVLHICSKSHNHIRTVPEIRSERDVIVLHICSKSHDNDVWFPRY